MKYSSIFKWLQAIWNPTSPEATAVVDEVVESVIDDGRTYGSMIIHLKGGRSITMRSWVEKGSDITTNELWVGMTTWFADPEDNTPCAFSTASNEYNTCIAKSEVTQLELKKDKE